MSAVYVDDDENGGGVQTDDELTDGAVDVVVADDGDGCRNRGGSVATWVQYWSWTWGCRKWSWILRQ